MINAIRQRLRCLANGLLMRTDTSPPLIECLWRPFEWYGLARRRVRAELRIVQRRSDAILYEWGGYSVWWPADADVERLVTMFVEQFVASNPHYFTPPAVLPWRKDSVVIDVGSCEGLFALRAAREFGAGQVIAIEPGRLMAQLLRETFASNRLNTHMEVVQCLVGSQPGQARFNECPSDPTQASIHFEEDGIGDLVEIRTLDRLAECMELTSVDVIKIDAEGADFEILKGAENIVRKWKPSLLVTTYHCSEHAMQMCRWLEDLALGYKMVFRGITTMNTDQARPVLLLARHHALTSG
jgi:FkbM family methyltransferase